MGKRLFTSKKITGIHQHFELGFPLLIFVVLKGGATHAAAILASELKEKTVFN